MQRPQSHYRIKGTVNQRPLSTFLSTCSPPIKQNSHFYWNIAAVRAIIPGALKDEELLQPIEPGLAQYPAGSVEFVLGAATGIDAGAKSVKVNGDSDSSQRTIPYDYLVVATGSNATASGLPWKASSSYEDLVGSLHRTAEQIKAASHIVVVGGGATGVEVCAEIRHEFKASKEVVLVNATQDLVGGDSTASSIEKELRSMGVIIKMGVGASGTAKQPDGKTRVTLDNGESIETDLYLPTTGLTPNSDFLPAEFLNESKYVSVDECMRVPAAENVWAAGDVVSRPFGSFLNTEAQVCHVCLFLSSACADIKKLVLGCLCRKESGARALRQRAQCPARCGHGLHDIFNGPQSWGWPFPSHPPSLTECLGGKESHAGRREDEEVRQRDHVVMRILQCDKGVEQKKMNRVLCYV